MMYGYNMMGYGWGLMMVVIMLIWALLVVLGILALIKYLKLPVNNQQGRSTPMDILKERYAKGEINVEDFNRMKEELEKK